MNNIYYTIANGDFIKVYSEDEVLIQLLDGTCWRTNGFELHYALQEFVRKSALSIGKMEYSKD